ncbi:HAD family hydrolase [Kitasatospora sp. NPDC090091]|uniref:HAD family hydrolase n=1 Tax=Kitasatospora sp. NPDC090091 TaxID=3364081 RepID=UPI00380FD346
MSTRVLVLWDIDRTLLYVGETDRAVYREAFTEVVGHEPASLPKRGTGTTMPLAVRELLLANGVPQEGIEASATQIVERLPLLLSDRIPALQSTGRLMPGARPALEAVHAHPVLIPTVVTGNLQQSATIKLSAFGLGDLVDPSIGGYASDDSHRPALVAVAQRRARTRYGIRFDRSNTVIVGDSLEDVRTGLEGGAFVIAVASGTTPAEDLAAAGADRVLDDLQDPEALIRAILDLTGLGH